MKNLIVTLTGPSCGGKTFLLDLLLEKHGNLYAPLRSYTTRRRRVGEGDGEYIFVTREDFTQAASNNEIVQFTEYSGELYGTPTSELDRVFKEGKIAVRIVEPTGVGQFRAVAGQFDAEVFSVYVTESEEVLMKRWLFRVAREVLIATQHGEMADIPFLSARILETLRVEQKWIELPGTFDFLLDPGRMSMNEALHFFGRLGSRKLPLYNARLVSPLPASTRRSGESEPSHATVPENGGDYDIKKLGEPVGAYRGMVA